MTELTSQSILNQTIALIRSSGVRAAIALGGLTVAGVLVDLAGQSGQRLNIVDSAISIAMQYWLTGELLEELGLRNGTGGRFWQVFGVCFLTNIGIFLGFVLLIIPGLVLLVRWSISVPHVLSDENMGVIDAIGRSWQETADDFWPILIVLLLIYLPFALASFASAYAFGPDAGGVLPSLVFNLFIGAAAIGGWHANVAVFAARRPEMQLADTFA